jgi:2-octaprenylphenol hydroxylase
MTTQYDIAIVGAGLVGQAIAAALSCSTKTSLRIALINPATLSAPKAHAALSDYDLRVSALTAQSQAFLTRIGVWNNIPAQVLSPYQCMHVWDAEGTGSVTFDAADLHVPALGHIVENRQTLWALNQVTQACDNIDRIQSVVSSFDNPNEAGYVPVLLGNGDTLFTRLLVGADGALSNVRQLAGMATSEWDYGQHAIVATVRTSKSVEATAWQRFRPEGPLAFLPLHSNNCLASIVWSTQPEEADAVLAMSDDDFCSALSQAFEGRLGDVMEVSPRQRFPLRQRHARQYYDRGIVVAGDAAHTIHPLAGQGVNLGFKDAEVLAEEIIRATNKGLSPGADSVLARYQRRRQADNLATMAAMEGFKRLFGSDQPLVRLLRNEGMRLFDKVMPVKQHVIMRAMGLDEVSS